MGNDRREFLRNVGWTLISLAGARQLAGCGPAVTGATTGGATGGAGTEGGAGDRNGAWARLRAAWLELPKMCERGEGWNTDPGSEDLQYRQAEDRAALDELVAAGELRAAVAALLGTAFDDVAWHAWRSCNGPTCYEPTMLGAALMESRGRVVRRLEELDRAIADGSIDADLAADARSTFEQQLAIFDAEEALAGLEGQERWDAEARLVETMEAGGPEATEDEREAARVLVELLLSE